MKQDTTKTTRSAYVSEADLINRATRALKAKAKRDGFLLEQPSTTLSEFDRARSVVILRNRDRTLGVYAFSARRDRLAWVDRELPNVGAAAAAALGSIDAVLARWLPNGKRRGKEYMALNPSRSGNQLSINTATGAWAAFATGDRGGDLVSLVAFIDQCSQVEAARRLADHGKAEGGAA